MYLEKGVHINEWQFIDGNGPRFGMFNFDEGSLEILKDNIGDTDTFQLVWTKIDEQYHYINNSIRIRYDNLEDGVIDHTEIKEVSIKFKADEDIPMEKESFLFVYQ